MIYARILKKIVVWERDFRVCYVHTFCSLAKGSAGKVMCGGQYGRRASRVFYVHTCSSLVKGSTGGVDVLRAIMRRL